MSNLLATATAVWEKRLTNGALPISSFKGKRHHPYLTLLKVLNIQLRKAGYDRHSALSLALGREIRSTYDLTVGEAEALTRLLAYSNYRLEEDV